MPDLKWPLPLDPYMGGKWVKSKADRFLVLRSATDDSLVTEKLAACNGDDVDWAVEEAEKSFPVWEAMPATEKSACLEKLADLVLENVERLAYLEVIVTGKPISILRLEVNSLARALRYYGGFTDKLEGELKYKEDGTLVGVVRQPYGVCACILAFNSPIIFFGMKCAPALATGNVIIVKTSEVNPLSIMYLAELATEAGFPPGAINILHGDAVVGQALASHMKIRKISFTGSTAVGRKVQVAAAQSNLKRVTLELGGKSPVLVFADADIASAVTKSMFVLVLNGQGCVLGTRIYVEESIADSFIEALKSAFQQFASNLGSDPFDPTTFSSPLFHQAQLHRVMGFLDKGKTEATVITGGERFGSQGCYVQPTIFVKATDSAEITQNEIFGPVVVIDTFKTEKEALKKANSSEYGLGAYIHTKSIDRAFRLSRALEAGNIGINTGVVVDITAPFGGWKGSGLGYENSGHALHCWTQLKSIHLKFNPTA